MVDKCFVQVFYHVPVKGILQYIIIIIIIIIITIIIIIIILYLTK